MFVKSDVLVLSTSADPNDDYACIEIACSTCGIEHLIGTTLSGYVSWRAGAFVQDAFPDVPKEYREMFISGTCPECFERMFGSFDDDDEAITL
jgi:hypothetical protein